MPGSTWRVGRRSCPIAQPDICGPGDADFRRPRALAHADCLAQAVDLDIAAAWKPTVDNFLGRVTKARILQAVTEAKGSRAADRIEHLKKGDMATEAAVLLADTGWVPEPLRTPGRATIDTNTIAADAEGEETTVDRGESVMADDETSADNDADEAVHMIAAE